MPLKANIGVSKKIGLPNYGSAGASLNIELELDARMLDDDPDEFRARIRHLYGLAEAAVAEELERLRGESAIDQARERREPEPARQPVANGATNGQQHREKPPPWGGNANRFGGDQQQPRGDRRSGGGERGDPRTGRALFAFLKDLEERDADNRGLIKWVGDWAKREGIRGRFVDWSETEIRDAVAAVREQLGGAN